MPPRATPLRIDDDLTRRRHAHALAALIDGEVRFDHHNRMLYATDASIYQVEPIGVVIPAHETDLRRVVEYCRDHALPILPRGGGTSLAGQCVNHALVLDLSANLTNLEWIDQPRRLCSVQPGITIDDLNDRLHHHSLFFAPDPATARQCAIGGAIGNNAAGTRSIRYGRTSENLEALSILLSTGEAATLAQGSAATDPVARRLTQGIIDICTRYEPHIRARFPTTLRRNAGFALDMMLAQIDGARRAGLDPLNTLNLAPLLCGSEGALALVTRATLRLQPIPKAKGLALLAFDSLDAAIDAVLPLLQLHPSAVELLDDLILSLAERNIECRRHLDLMPRPATGPRAAILFVEHFSEHGPQEIADRLDETRRLLARIDPAAGFAACTDPASMNHALELRKAGEPLLHALPGSRKPLGFVEDNAVPVERLAEFVRAFRLILANHNTRAAFWAHASVGVLHVRPLLDLRDPDDRAHMEAIALEVADLARSLGGIMSGEHGDGRARGPLLERHFGPELMRAFRELKLLFDPLSLLNPGNIVPLPHSPTPTIASIHESTRVRPLGENLPTTHINSYFDYSADQGLDHAVELCNGSGVCRKKQGGTMCPSFRATLDERHSTRGRGNALRLAITGQSESSISNAPIWNDPQTLETLHLCLSCKACKSECPSNVDIAQYKAEYLAQSYKAARSVPLRARVLGHVRILNRLGSLFAPLSNRVANSALHRALLNPLLNLDKRRSLPPFAPSLFRQARRAFPDFRREAGALVLGPPAAPALLLYADCFTTYNEPHIGLATLRVALAFGYRLALIDAGCCARALISTGCLEDAQRTIADTAARLAAALDHFNPAALLFCEPSCLSALKDEWRKLILPASAPPPATLDRLASLAFLPEDFLDKHWDDHPLRPSFSLLDPAAAVTLHPHCHQKALWGADSSARLLRRIVGDSLRILDSGCCGLAGAFGYSPDRYDLSAKIAGLALLPELRRLTTRHTILAPGASCRHQIHDLANRAAQHPIVFLDSLLRT